MLGFSKHSRLFFAISMAVFILAVTLASWGIPLIVRKQIQKNVQLDNSSQMFEKWRKIPMPLSFRVHLFNVTNPDEVNNGEKPMLAEVGPYIYEEYRERTILGYGENDTIEYMLQKRFYFNSTASGTLTEDDEVTVINFSYMAALLSVAELMPGLLPMVNDALGDFFSDLTDPFLRVKVKDLLYDGIYLNCASNKSALGLVCGKIRADTPSTMRLADDGNGFWFSMFSHMNRTPSGPYAMVRGTQNLRELGHIVSYKGKQRMTQWGDKYCGQLNGSDSSIFPPVDESDVPEKLYIFEPEICRSLYASLVGKSTLFNMSAYYYELAESALAAKSANPNNRCFCRRNWSANHDGCLIMGLLNLMPCQGAPAIVSLPHFYLGSEELLEFFAGGVEPDPEKHKTFVYLEPKTGVVLKGLQRLQFNIELRNMPQIPQLEKVPTGLFPLLWIEEGATLPEPIVEELRYSHQLLSYADKFRWVFLACSFLLLAVSVIAVVRSGTIPIFPKASNTVSFVLRPGNFQATDKVQ